MDNNRIMTLKPIINSLLETDAYKFSMGQAIFHQFNKDKTTWTFRCRNNDVKFTSDMVEEIRAQIDHYCTLRFEEDELKWLNDNLPWIHEDYTDFLRFWHPRKEEIFINEDGAHDYNNCGLTIEARGSWLNTSMYEIAILAIVNEVYFSFTYGEGDKNKEFQKKTIEKFEKMSDPSKNEWIHNVILNDELDKYGDEIEKYQNAHPYDIGTFSEFGLRRRYSAEMQDWLIGYIVNNKIPGFVGTSNVYLAKKYGVKAVGTQAHEWVMTVGQAHHEFNPAYSNKFALKYWVKEYGILNGIALTDTITTDCFLRDFQLTYATLFSGVRHDSGDPIEWGEKIIEHYRKLGINPKTKTLLFSDSLDFTKATAIKRYFDGRAKVAFGIGTYLSNPLDNPLNIVMKITKANGNPVAKISDTAGKGLCEDEKYVEYLNKTIGWRMAHVE